MGRTATEHDEDDRWADDSLLVSFRDGFRFGRKTSDECDHEDSDGVSLMPDAEQGCTTIKNIMVDHMFGNEDSVQDAFDAAATIMGTHTLGSAKEDNSGYIGHWSDTANQGIFNNNYYRSIIMKGWAPEYEVGGREDRNQWKRVDRMEGENDEMMLTTDMCLFYDDNSNHRDCLDDGGNVGSCADHRVEDEADGVFLDPLETNCCAWHFVEPLYDDDAVLEDGITYDDFCGVSVLNGETTGGGGGGGSDSSSGGSSDSSSGGSDSDSDDGDSSDEDLSSESSMERTCCRGAGRRSVGDCAFAGDPKGSAASIVRKFAADESFFLTTFVKHWKTATGNGYSDLESLESSSDLSDAENNYRKPGW